jgi:hypothetical protein
MRQFKVRKMRTTISTSPTALLAVSGSEVVPLHEGVERAYRHSFAVCYLGKERHQIYALFLASGLGGWGSFRRGVYFSANPSKRGCGKKLRYVSFK